MVTLKETMPIGFLKQRGAFGQHRGRVLVALVMNRCLSFVPFRGWGRP